MGRKIDFGSLAIRIIAGLALGAALWSGSVARAEGQSGNYAVTSVFDAAQNAARVFVVTPAGHLVEYSSASSLSNNEPVVRDVNADVAKHPATAR